MNIAPIFALQGVPWAGIWWLEISVFYLLVILSAIVMQNIFSKYRKFQNVRKYSRQYALLVAEELKVANIEEAIKVSKNFSKKSHLAEVVLIGLEEYVHAKKKFSREIAFNFAKEHMENKANVLKYEYEKGVGFLDAIGRTSPFIGALGGSATTFTIGILIAIPSVWFATYERNKAGQLVIQIKNVASELMAFFEYEL